MQIPDQVYKVYQLNQILYKVPTVQITETASPSMSWFTLLKGFMDVRRILLDVLLHFLK